MSLYIPIQDYVSLENMIREADADCIDFLKRLDEMDRSELSVIVIRIDASFEDLRALATNGLHLSHHSMSYSRLIRKCDALVREIIESDYLADWRKTNGYFRVLLENARSLISRVGGRCRDFLEALPSQKPALARICTNAIVTLERMLAEYRSLHRLLGGRPFGRSKNRRKVR